MRSALRTALSIVNILVCLTTVSYASVVSVDTTAKSASCDVSTLQASDVVVTEGQLDVRVKSTVPERQQFVLKVAGLTEHSYDMYANGTFVGTNTAEQLSAGINMDVDGRIVDGSMSRCLEMVRPRVEGLLKRLQNAKDAESQRVCGTLAQAVAWTSAGIMADQEWRSVHVVLGPSGRALHHTGVDTRKDDAGTAEAVVRACWLLQQARARMSAFIRWPQLRDDAVAALTPIDLRATYGMKNKKPHVEVDLANNCNLPASGAFSVSLPKGWKCTAKNMVIKPLKSGQTCKVSFDLTALSKAAPVPESLPVGASLKISEKPFTATIRLKMNASKQ